MRVRDIILKADKHKLGSKGIAKVTNSHYSHTAVHTENNDVIEAEFPRVICTPYEQWKRNNEGREYYYSDWYDCHIDVKKLVGKKYELGRFVNFVAWKIARWFGSYILASWVINRDNTKKVVCSELNGLCRGLPNPHKLIPKDFEKFIKKS